MPPSPSYTAALARRGSAGRALAVVQWIERPPPKRQIQVRFLSAGPATSHPGQVLRTPGGSDRFWRVLRLDGAPRPALLTSTAGVAEREQDITVATLSAASAARLVFEGLIRGMSAIISAFALQASARQALRTWAQ